jgi:tRNA (guanosine-2'-O-)-methyltransferase
MSDQIDIEKSRELKKARIRKRANEVKKFRCKNLIAVIEDPMNIVNIGTIIRNIEALGVEKTYIVDPRKMLPDDWQEMRERKSLKDTSVSAIKWSFVKRFDSTEACIEHLKKKGFVSAVTSPHIKGQNNIVLHEGVYTQTKLAVWFGNEAKGISDTAVENGEFCINIPMYGFIESLNLGTSTGIVLYEITKQRRAYQAKYKRVNRNKSKTSSW